MILSKKHIDDMIKCENSDSITVCPKSCSNSTWRLCGEVQTRKTIVTIYQLLKKLEWNGLDNDKNSHCPICYGHKTDGHADDCDLGKLLRGDK